MNFIILIISLLILLISLAVIVFLLLFSIDSIIHGHDTPTSRRVIMELVKIIKKHAPQAKTFYDLGSGRGTVTLTVKKAFPDLEVVGVDSSGARVFIARLKAWLLRRDIKFVKSDFFKIDLSPADLLYTYIWYDHLPPLEKKTEKELRSSSVVICNTSHFPHWQPVAKYVTNPNRGLKNHPDHETLFVYVKE